MPRPSVSMDMLLTGQNLTTHIVGMQLLNDQQIRLYRRTADGVLHEDAEFFPFFFLTSPALLRGFQKKHWLKRLEGHHVYNHLAAFTRWSDLWDAVRVTLEAISRESAEKVTNYAEARDLHLRPDPLTQYLLQSGVTLFKGMDFKDVRRMQIAMAVHISKGTAADVRRTEDRILAAVLTDNHGGKETLDGRTLTEKELLERIVAIIRERDPDILEGHGILGQTLPYLLGRCELCGVECAIGRDQTEPRSIQGRWSFQESDGESPLFEIAGRHLVDTLFQAEQFDFSKRSLESFDLPSVIQTLGLSSDNDVIMTPREIPPRWESNPRQVLDHLQTTVRHVNALSEYLSPSSFFLGQMVPLPYGTLTRSGSAVKIELLLLREYLRLKHSIPAPQEGVQITGGYSDLFMTGIFHHVVHADVESLYPSIILSRSIEPQSDTLHVFLRLLEHLVALRLDAKRSMKTATSKKMKAHVDALQSSFKILINSFYGYLGYARGLFNDYSKADEITRAGQELLKKIIRQIELYNGRVIEVDTDGVYFLSPDNIVDEEQEAALIERISRSLPEGINLVPAGRFDAMMSYKKKNYALREFGGDLIVRGSSLISRSMERFLRRFLKIAIARLLEGSFESLHSLYATLTQDILHHRWEAADFCRTETIHDSFDRYEQDLARGNRNPAAAYEVTRLAGLPVKPGDRISYYVTGSAAGVKISEHCKLAEEWDPNFPDENTAYYLARLEETVQKFEAFFKPEDFRNIFTVDDLFGFDPSGIQLLQQEIEPEEGERGRENRESTEFRIWLGEP